jgi:hypothetical protein
MDAFSYLSVLLSIILGLAITQLLTGFRGIVLARTRVRLFLPSLLWAVVLVAINVQAWWAMFQLRIRPVWTFSAFAIVLLEPILLYLMAALVLPDFPPGETVELRTHYFDHQRIFFGLGAALPAVSMAKDLVLTGQWTSGGNLAFHLGFIALSLTAAIVKRERYHQVLAPFMVVVFLAYIGALFTQLR